MKRFYYNYIFFLVIGMYFFCFFTLEIHAEENTFEPEGVPVEGVFSIPSGADSKVMSEDTILITDSKKYQIGSIFSTSDNKFNLYKDLHSEMYIKINGKADGITFIMHDDTKRANKYSGAIGQSLGAYAETASKSIGMRKQVERSFVVEFDTYFNNDSNHPFDTKLSRNENRGHVAWAFPEKWSAYDFNNDGKITALNHNNVQYPKTFSLGDNQWRLFTVDWKALDSSDYGYLTYQLEGLDPVKVKIPHNVFGKNTQEVYWGFTGATGGSVEEAIVKFFSVPGLVYYDDKFELYNKNNVILDATSLVKGDEEITVRYHGDYNGGKQNLLKPKVSFELSEGQIFVPGTLTVNGEIKEPIINNNQIQVAFSELSGADMNSSVDIQFKVKLDNISSNKNVNIISKVDATNFKQKTGHTKSYMVDGNSPKGVGKITAIKQYDIESILNESDFSKYIFSYSDDFSSQENITVSLKDGQDIKNIVSRLGASQLICNLKDQVGNTRDVKVPLLIIPENDISQIISNARYLLKGNNFDIYNNEYPKKNSYLTEFFSSKTQLELWYLDEDNVLNKQSDLILPKNINNLPLAGSSPKIDLYPIVFTYGNDENELTLELTMNVLESKPGNIIIKYVDEKGVSIENLIPTVIISGDKIGDEYDVLTKMYQPELSDYKIDNEQLPKNGKGIYTSKDIVVMYVYQKNDKYLITKKAYKGALSFTWAPKEFKLGTRSFLSSSEAFELQNEVKNKQWLVVNEGREDNDTNFGKSWSVKAKMSNLKVNDQDIIEGASLLFTLNKLKKYNLGNTMNATNTDIVPNNPNYDNDAITEFEYEPTDILLGNSSNNEDKVEIEIKASADGEPLEEQIISQKSNRTGSYKKREGFATKLSNQRLYVPQFSPNFLNKEYSTIITWTLSHDIY